MGKYELAVWPQEQYRYAIFDNVQKLPRAKDVLKANPGAIAAINLALFAMKAYPDEGVKVYDHQADVKIKGKWEYGPRWPDVVGICIDKDGYAKVGRVRDDAWEYAACKTVNYLDGAVVTAPSNFEEGLTYYAFKSTGDLITLVVSKDNKMTPAAVVQILRSLGAVTILEYDGSWSSQGIWPGIEINPSEQRTCRTWLLIYPRDNQKEENPVSYKVTASVGLNIRKEASSSATKVGAYACGALVSVLEVKDGWGRTDKGWVSMSYLEAVTPSTSTDKAMTELQVRANIVSIAKAYLGATVGSAAHKDLIDTYNTIKPLPRGYKMTYTDPWCAATVSAFAIKAGLTDIIPPECSCGAMIQLFQALGRWQENDAYVPQSGDILFYDWDDSGVGDNKGAADHVGIVSVVTGSTITVIEGNYNKAVRERTMQVNGRYIRGYGLPDYAAKADKPVNDNALGADDWASEAWAKAKEKGIMDGTRPTAPVTRQELAVVLDRLGLMG